MLGHKVRSVRDWEVFRIKRREGQAGSNRFTGRLAKVTQLIDNAVDGLGKLNEEERVWSCLIVGESDAQLIRGKCSTNEERLWGNLSALTGNCRWLPMQVVVLEGMRWQLNGDPKTLDHDHKYGFSTKAII